MLHARPELRINGAPAGLPELAARLEYMWPAGEPIVYIGRSGSTLRKRVGAFYRHKLGAPKPHGGGWPVKLLNPDQLWVHFASTQESLHIEIEMLDAFTAGLPVPARVALIDSDLALPFANLERKKGQTKKHGITGAK